LTYVLVKNYFAGAAAGQMHAGIGLYMFEKEGCCSIIGTAALHESPEDLQVLLDAKADVNNQDRAEGPNSPPCSPSMAAWIACVYFWRSMRPR
jgi:hypothetical protein